MVAFSTSRPARATATVGIAWVSVRAFNSVSLLARAMMPVMTTATATQAARRPKTPNFRPDAGGELFSVDMHCLRDTGGFRGLFFVDHAENHGHEHQRGSRCKNQTTDHCSSERSVLLATFAEAQCHWRHADDHRQRSHQHGTEPDEAGFQRRGDRVSQVGIAL